MKKNIREDLLALFAENKGYVVSNQLNNRSMRYQLKLMVQKGEVSRLRTGLYVLNDFPAFDELQLVSEIIPEGIFCLFSAWDLHQLTTTIPHIHCMAVSRPNRVVIPDYPPVKLYIWSKKYYEAGIMELKRETGTIRVYNPERSVCDAFRFRNKVGQEMCNEVLRNYLLLKNKNIDLLMHYSRELRVEKTITPYLLALL